MRPNRAHSLKCASCARPAAVTECPFRTGRQARRDRRPDRRHAGDVAAVGLTRLLAMLEFLRLFFRRAARANGAASVRAFYNARNHSENLVIQPRYGLNAETTERNKSRYRGLVPFPK